MWIAFRLLLAIGFAIQRWRRKRKIGIELEHKGRPYWESIHRSKGGSIRGFSLGMPRSSPARMRFHRESDFDRWVKRLGFSKEIQTGDPRFDDFVYVTCDHPFVEKTLTERPELRSAVSGALQRGYQLVELDGTSLVLERESSEGPATDDLELLQRVDAALEHLESNVPSRFADPFFRKALLVEAFIWSIAGYTVGTFLTQPFIASEDFYVSESGVLWTGLAVAIVAFVALLGWIGVWLRGSSRGHRIIVESTVVLFIWLPFAGIRLVADTNRTLDTSEPERVSAAVNGCKVHEYRRIRRWSPGYSYHVGLAPDARLPQSIKVTRRLCAAVQKSSERPVLAEIWLGRGLWRVPWYRRISIDGVTWEPPY